tara:strand:- start:2927 stop:3727 length:801 start_codon:yes stop_codon:yes gene_type:complete
MRYIGFLAIGVIVVGEIFANLELLLEGYPLFYGRPSLFYRFSLDYPLFIAYWASLVGIYYFVKEFELFKVLRQFKPNSEKTGIKSSKTIQSELSEIEDLYSQSVITEEERNKMRARILDIRGLESSNLSNEANETIEEFNQVKTKKYSSSDEFFSYSLAPTLTFVLSFFLISYSVILGLVTHGLTWWVLLYLVIGVVLAVVVFGIVALIGEQLYDEGRSAFEVILIPTGYMVFFIAVFLFMGVLFGQPVDESLPYVFFEWFIEMHY